MAAVGEMDIPCAGFLQRPPRPESLENYRRRVARAVHEPDGFDGR